ncbi:hypothetical protein BN1051_02583 [Arthrobacter saudimassiliensis]|uniref:Uncharacterized protein n=1 Tax=Arthrobacter saudimassiliensis TaxID=1461584 RepID=A0A078MWM0_9MICC|nr:hypothetical protein BN1051_02583 [Arthrobacter saudimassiliensis]
MQEEKNPSWPADAGETAARLVPPTRPPQISGADPHSGAPYAPQEAPRRRVRGSVFTAGAWLIVGAAAGYGLAQIDFGPRPPEPSEMLTQAVTNCAVREEEGIELGDAGQSLTMDSQGTDYWSVGAEWADIDCVLRKLDVPDSVLSRMDNTRALDGRQTAQWGSLTASWGYHPDSGINIVIELVEAPE